MWAFLVKVFTNVSRQWAYLRQCGTLELPFIP